ncbi:hypothetical protein SAMN05216321_12040 [Cupriavidus sp. OV038]|jgi:hypothetical protein|uniref:hypothetical protein n=1 Tax=unclassified Cupriavidus TaxID=2640874 RepID=UPI0008EF36DD|nr:MULTISPECIES: hypothetical protein [unclassified Cupriavidus]SFD43842.1 hypothetical protein SAMN05216321_12040 [Cupriavidus sp. OV038]SFQ14342.1 hypothetical protein SAMN05216322_11940 [Cupriavidus sp. OV096]
MQRRHFLAALAVSTVATSGCVTRKLFKEIDKPRFRDYQETASQILISQDKKSLVVLGKRYHYVMAAPKGLVEVIQSALHPRVRAVFSTFTVDLDGNVMGRLTLKAADAFTAEEVALAVALGFPKNCGTERCGAAQYTIKGKRYAAGDTKYPDPATPLNQSYTIPVREELGAGARNALVLLTPVAVAADGVLVLVAIPLVAAFAVYYVGKENVR